MQFWSSKYHRWGRHYDIFWRRSRGEQKVVTLNKSTEIIPKEEEVKGEQIEERERERFMDQPLHFIAWHLFNSIHSIHSFIIIIFWSSDISWLGAIVVIEPVFKVFSHFVVPPRLTAYYAKRETRPQHKWHDASHAIKHNRFIWMGAFLLWSGNLCLCHSLSCKDSIDILSNTW